MQDLMVLIFFYFVQAFLMIVIGLDLFSVKYKYKDLLRPVVVYGTSVWLIRKVYEFFHIPFGTHTLVLFIIFCLTLKYLLNLKLSYVFSMSFINISLIMLGDCIIVYINRILTYTNIEFIDYIVHIMYGHIENMFLLFLFILLKLTKINIFKIIGEIEKSG